MRRVRWIDRFDGAVPPSERSTCARSIDLPAVSRNELVVIGWCELRRRLARPHRPYIRPIDRSLCCLLAPRSHTRVHIDATHQLDRSRASLLACLTGLPAYMRAAQDGEGALLRQGRAQERAMDRRGRRGAGQVHCRPRRRLLEVSPQERR